MNSASDIYFLIESFKVFFEKMLDTFSDPKGIAAQEWLKFKDTLTSKDSTGQSIYSYATNLVVVKGSSTNSNNMVKLKRQASRQVDQANTPRRMIARRNSFGTGNDSPTGDARSVPQASDSSQPFSAVSTNVGAASANQLNFTSATSVGANPSGLLTDTNKDNGIHHYNTANNLAPGLIDSPWTMDAVERKQYNPSALNAQRVNINEIQQMKGLSEVAHIGSKGSKQTEQFQQSQKLLLTQIRSCIEKYQRDTTGLDLIHDRSFSTQTVLIENKRQPFERGVKRQDSKFIRELSVYTKKGPGGGAASPQQKEALTQEQKNFLMSQQNEYLQQNAPAATVKPDEAAAVATPTITTTTTHTTSAQNTYTANPYLAGIGTTDYVKVKTNNDHSSQTSSGSGIPTYNKGVVHTANPSRFATTTTPNNQNSTNTPPSSYGQIPQNNVQTPSIPTYFPSTQIQGLANTYGIHIENPSSTQTVQTTTAQYTSTNTTTTNPGIDDIVQRILNEQKQKDLTAQQQSPHTPLTNITSTPTTITTSDTVQEILMKHKFNSPGYTTTTTTTTTTTAGSIGSSNNLYTTSPYSLNSTLNTNVTTTTPLYQPSGVSPIKGLDIQGFSSQQYPYTTPPSTTQNKK